MAVYEINTKEALFSSIYRLLQIKRIDDISVDEIIGNAHVSRSTFYRNFCDKYELLHWSYERLLLMTFSTIIRDVSLEEACTMTFAMYDSHQNFFRNGLDSLDVNSLRKAILETNREYWRELLRKASIDPDANSNMHVVDMFLEGTITRLANWINSDTREEPEVVTREVLAAVPVRFASCLEVKTSMAALFNNA